MNPGDAQVWTLEGASRFSDAISRLDEVTRILERDGARNELVLFSFTFDFDNYRIVYVQGNAELVARAFRFALGYVTQQKLYASSWLRIELRGCGELP